MLKDDREIRGYGNMSTYGYIKHDELSGYAIAHHGIKGQKWGIRRYQNPDGTLTEAGKKRYGVNYISKNPEKRLRTGNAYDYQNRMYKDIGKAIKKENKGIKKSDIDDKIRNEYKNIYKDNDTADIHYNLGKSANEYKKDLNRMSNPFNPVGGAVGGALYGLASTKDQTSPMYRHSEYTKKLISKIHDDEIRNDAVKKYIQAQNERADWLKERQNLMEKTYGTKNPYKVVKGAEQSWTNFNKKKAIDDCAKMIDIHHKMYNSDSKTFSAEEVQSFFENNLKEFNDLWINEEESLFDTMNEVENGLIKKGYKFVD